MFSEINSHSKSGVPGNAKNFNRFPIDGKLQKNNGEMTVCSGKREPGAR